MVLRVTIDAEGVVEEADVIEPAGHGFDESARATALRTRYTAGVEVAVSTADGATRPVSSAPNEGCSTIPPCGQRVPRARGRARMALVRRCRAGLRWPRYGVPL